MPSTTVTSTSEINRRINYSTTEEEMLIFLRNSLNDRRNRATLYSETFVGDGETIEFELTNDLDNNSKHKTTNILNIKYNSPYEGIVSYWNFDGNANDSVGDNDGISTAVSASGIVNTGYSITYGESQAIVVSDDSTLDLNVISVSCWFKFTDPENGDNHTIFSKYNGTTGFEMFVQGGSLYLQTNSDTSDVGVSISNDVWYNVVLYINNNVPEVKVYVNTVLEFSNSGTLLYTPNDADLYFGVSAQGTGRFNGIIDESGIWNRELNSTDLALLYNSRNGSTYYSATEATYIDDYLFGYKLESDYNGKIKFWNAPLVGQSFTVTYKAFYTMVLPESSRNKYTSGSYPRVVLQVYGRPDAIALGCNATNHTITFAIGIADITMDGVNELVREIHNLFTQKKVKLGFKTVNFVEMTNVSPGPIPFVDDNNDFIYFQAVELTSINQVEMTLNNN